MVDIIMLSYDLPFLINGMTDFLPLEKHMIGYDPTHIGTSCTYFFFMASSFVHDKYSRELKFSRFKFDDERVTKEDAKKALEEQYGGEEEVSCNLQLLRLQLFYFQYINTELRNFVLQLPQTNPGLNNTPFKFTKYSNAYMLVYIRESDKDKIICNVDEKDIAEHLRVCSTLKSEFQGFFFCSLY